MRDAGTDQGHPINKAIHDENESLIGPQLGRGGTEKPMGPLEVTDTYCEPYRSGSPDEKYVAGVDPAVAKAPQFMDVSSLIVKTKGS
jgi:hypothetical protein